MEEKTVKTIKCTCIWIAFGIFVILIGVACYAGCCNIRATTFNNAEARDGLINMAGSVYWGWPLAIISFLFGGTVLGLLVVEFLHIRGPKDKKETRVVE